LTGDYYNVVTVQDNGETSQTKLDNINRSQLVEKMTPFFNDVMLRLPSVLRINKRFDLRKAAEREPTAAVNELIETVKALNKESELFAALKELEIKVD